MDTSYNDMRTDRMYADGTLTEPVSAREIADMLAQNKPKDFGDIVADAVTEAVVIAVRTKSEQEAFTLERFLGMNGYKFSGMRRNPPNYVHVNTKSMKYSETFNTLATIPCVPYADISDAVEESLTETEIREGSTVRISDPAKAHLYETIGIIQNIEDEKDRIRYAYGSHPEPPCTDGADSRTYKVLKVWKDKGIGKEFAYIEDNGIFEGYGCCYLVETCGLTMA